MRIKEKTSENVVFFPKNLGKTGKIHTILLHSELTNEDYKFDDVLDTGDLIDYYVFTCDFSNIPDGEYKYNIDNDACGLIILGDLNKKTKEENVIFTENNNKYIVYEG